MQDPVIPCPAADLNGKKRHPPLVKQVRFEAEPPEERQGDIQVSDRGGRLSQNAIKNRQAATFFQQGNYPQAESLFREILEDLIRSRGQEHSQTLTAQHNLANVLFKQYKFREAADLFAGVVNAKRCTLGSTDPGTLQVMYSYACALWALRSPAALPLLREVVEGRRVTLGEDHPDTQTAQRALEGWLAANAAPEQTQGLQGAQH